MEADAAEAARQKEEKARRKAEAEAQPSTPKIEAKLAQHCTSRAVIGRHNLKDDDGLATESDSDKEEQERLEEERRNKLRRLEEKKMKLEEDEDDEDDWTDWMSGRKVEEPGSHSVLPKLDKAAAAAAAAAARKEQELQQKVAELNDRDEGVGRQRAARGRATRCESGSRVGGDFPTMVLTEWNAKGALSVEAWRSIRKKVSGTTAGEEASERPCDSGDQSADKSQAVIVTCTPHTPPTALPSHFVSAPLPCRRRPLTPPRLTRRSSSELTPTAT